jgi:hypothetical protein
MSNHDDVMCARGRCSISLPGLRDAVVNSNVLGRAPDSEMPWVSRGESRTNGRSSGSGSELKCDDMIMIISITIIIIIIISYQRLHTGYASLNDDFFDFDICWEYHLFTYLLTGWKNKIRRKT